MWFSTVCTLIDNNMHHQMVKICWTLTWLHLMGPQHFDYCDDVCSLLIRVKTMLNHIQVVKYHNDQDTMEMKQDSEPQREAW